MNKQELAKLLQENKTTGQLDWKRGIVVTMQNKTLLEVVRRLADK